MPKARPRHRCALTLLALLAAAPALAQLTGRVESNRRTVAAYDFEEPDNPFAVPADFFRAQSDPDQGITRPGYPVYNRAAFSEAHARSGRRSILLPVERGSTCLRLRPGALPIFADADYRVTCFVRGEQLTHARFRLVARLLAEDTTPIPGAEYTSDPAAPGNDWTPIEINVQGGAHPNAAFLQIDAELVQPEQYQEPTLGQHQVWPEDLTARVWMDDLAVSQLPRIWLRASTPGGVVAAEDSPPTRTMLEFLVRDLTGDRLAARLTITDAQGRPVVQEQLATRSAAIPQTWPVQLPRFGWYRATLDILANGEPVGQASCALALVPPPSSRTIAEGGFQQTGRTRFALAADDWNDQLLTALPTIGRALSTHGITIGAWNTATTTDAISTRTEKLVAVLTSADHDWADPAIALHTLPASIQASLVLDATGVLDALSRSRDTWQPYLDPMLDRLGQIATRWQIGSTSPRPDFSGTRGDLARVRSQLATLVPGPRIGITQRPHLAIPTHHTRDPDHLTLVFSPNTGVDTVEHAVSDWASSPLAEGTELTLAYGIRHDDAFAPDSTSAELVKRMIIAEAHAQPLGVKLIHQLANAWTLSERDGIVSPAPAVPAWRATIDRLRGRTVAAELDVTPGVRAYLLLPTDPDDPRGGALVAWNDDASPDNAWVRTNLGKGQLTRLDIWGNPTGTVTATQLESTGGSTITLHELPVSSMPTFVEGVDAEIAMFIASIRVDNPIIQTTPGPHQRNVVISNPWQVAIDGDIIILEPAERNEQGRRTGWDLSPRVSRFSIGPGETTDVPIELSFSAVELAGQKPFVADVIIRSGPVQDYLRAPSAITLTLDGIELDARAVIDRAGINVAIEAVVTNTSDEPLDLILHGATRGFPRQSASIAQLAPGASTVRRLVYPNGMARLAGSSIFVGIEDPARRARFNTRVPIE
ncbi:MAG: hypothetical protein AAFQ31_10045 [Planctomycetota bacterium]